jgi:DNA-binding NarL/FixJ family response regulator
LEEEAPTLRVTGVEVSLREAKRSIAELRPAVALIGLSAEHAEEVEAVREMCAAFPSTRVVVLLFEGEVSIASDALAGVGVAGYALKERDAAEIAGVVSLVARGHVVAPAAVAFPRERRPDPDSLDRVEWEILKGIARSETNRELAARLHLSERTICRRLESIYSKLDLADRLQAAVYAATHGVVTRGAATTEE